VLKPVCLVDHLGGNNHACSILAFHWTSTQNQDLTGYGHVSTYPSSSMCAALDKFDLHMIFPTF